MKEGKNVLVWRALLLVAAVCLVKLAFFSPSPSHFSLTPEAHAGSLLELKGPARMVSTSEDGSTAYVWDFENKTQLRKYAIKGDKLTLTEYKLDEK